MLFWKNHHQLAIPFLVMEINYKMSILFFIKAILEHSVWMLCGTVHLASTWIFKITHIIIILEDAKLFFDKWILLTCLCI